MRALPVAVLTLLAASSFAAAAQDHDGALASLLGLAPSELPATFAARTFRFHDGQVAQGTRDVPVAEVASWLAQAGDPRSAPPALPGALPPTFAGAGTEGGNHRGVSWIGVALVNALDECMAPASLVPGLEPVPNPVDATVPGANFYAAFEIALPHAGSGTAAAGMQTRVLPSASAVWTAVGSTDAVFHVMAGDATVVCRDAGWNVVSFVSIGGDGSIHGR